MEFADEDAASVWIIDNQKGRRNVSEIDRIMLSSKREEIISRKAKVNLKTSTGGNAPRPLAKLPKAAKVNTRRESAKAAGVGERTYDAGKLILKSVEDGTIKPEVLEDVRRGRAAIHRVAKDIKEKIQRDNRAKTRLQTASGQTIDSRIISGRAIKRPCRKPPFNRQRVGTTKRMDTARARTAREIKGQRTRKTPLNYGYNTAIEVLCYDMPMNTHLLLTLTR